MAVDINVLLHKAVSLKASDIHIKVGAPPIVRVKGKLFVLPDEAPLKAEDTIGVANGLMNQQQRAVFSKRNEMDLSYSILGLARFRCNFFQQRGTVTMVFRVIPFEVLSIEELNLPIVLKKIALEERGLILVTGTTGSGKSTTLAAMIDYINHKKSAHILTIEDPIEILHKDKRCIINQREVGADTETFATALRAALRQDPDVILVGEMRDFETIQTALVAAETGHLVMSTLHTLDAPETVNRIISVFPPYQHKQIRMQLASVLQAIISMRLIPTADGKGRAPVAEVLVSTATIRDCIEDPEKTKYLHDYIAQGFSQYGMQTFDQALYSLLKNSIISYEEAMRQATNPDDLALKMKGVQSTSDLWEEKDEGSTHETPSDSRIERF
jgi:twitching motility protein PilT